MTGQRFFDELPTLDVWEQAAKYNNPVLLLHGTKDEAVLPEVSSIYIDKCYGDQGKLHLIEGADHTFNSYEWEQDVIQSIVKFV